MDIRPIRSELDYQNTLKEIENLMSAQADSPEAERLDILVTLVEAYERKHYPMDLPDPVEALKFLMEQRGLTVKDLEPALGRPNRVYEVLARKRPLSLPMIRRLHERFGIPAEILLRCQVPG